MPQGATLRVEGLRELNRAFLVADKSVRKQWNAERRRLGEPVAQSAQALAASEIRNMPRSPSWAGMRVGITQNVVYVAPKSRSKSGRKRRNLAGLLMDRAMIPALERNQARTIRAVEKMLDRMGRDWQNA